MDLSYAKFLLEQTKKDYDKIASYFAKTRKYFPKDLYFVEQLVEKEDVILDLGCGNGIFFPFIRKKVKNYFGVDISSNLITLAKKTFLEGNFQVTPFLSLPFPSKFFDKVFCFAVLHHIPSKTFRIKFLKEIKRVLKPDGILILTVWNLWKEPKIWPLILKFTLLKILRLIRCDFKDIFYPFKNEKGEILANRYFHCFTLPELNSLFKQAGFKVENFKRIKRNNHENFLIVGKC